MNRKNEYRAAVLATEEFRILEDFLTRLDKVSTFVEAERLAIETPPQGSPGRKFYSNLAFFLQSFTVPAGSNYAERRSYLGLIQRLDAAGMLKPGVGKDVEQQLRQAMAGMH
jgi:hypothetical protein